ncbi:unnamed protein product [Polarella glacialis]|uniref:Uncharacterized protein n=1 Tax=Polarella glacialis TaxID=89957 RepID=A0A813L878_POLGL|nr:unnamed protein product [Polarella glacialis]
MFSPDGQKALIALDDSTARTFEVESGLNEHIFRPQRGEASRRMHLTSVLPPSLSCAVFSPGDARWLLTTASGPSVQLLDAETGTCLRTFQNSGYAMNSAVFSPDGSRVVTTSWEGTVRIYYPATGVCERTFMLGCGRDQLVDIPRHAEFSADQARLLVLLDRSHVEILDAETGDFMVGLEDHGEFVVNCSFSSDGRKVLTSSLTTVRIYDAESGKCQWAHECEDLSTTVFSSSCFCHGVHSARDEDN